ncbi:MAG: Ig-like domain-containing protein [Nitrospirota bacterium]
MHNIKPQRWFRTALIIAAFVLGMASMSSAAEFWLQAETLTITVSDAAVAGGVQVTMWGFGSCTAGFATCTPATVPGPQLTVPVGDTSLTIHVRNNLTGPLAEPVSIVIPGLPMPTDGAATSPQPVYFTDGNGKQRVRSFVHETSVGADGVYVWSAIKPGTYLYQSGTHPAVQIQMGLYGALKQDAAAGVPPVLGYAYQTGNPAVPVVPYSTEVILVYSEIDPVLHAHIAAGTYGTPPPTGITSTMYYEPKYFLINGQPFSGTITPLTGGETGKPTLVRLLNAGLETHVPIINGLSTTVYAEDGNLLRYPKELYALSLPAGKTMDVVFSPMNPGTYAVYDRALGLANGGMLTHLQIVGNPMPVAGNDSYSTNANTALNVPAPGVLGNDTGTGLSAVLVTNVVNGTLTLNADGSFTYTPNMGFSGTDSFTYRAVSGIQTSAPATVTIAVTGPTPRLYLSLLADQTIGGVAYANEDILVFDSNNQFSMLFDGSDVGVGGLNIDAFHVVDATHILMSFSTAAAIPGIAETVDDSDIVLFTATSLGENTAGTFSLYFDGSDVGLSTDTEDVDAIDLLPDGRLVISTTGGFTVPGLSGQDVDLIACSGTFGPTTTCTWSMYFDGSDVGLSADGGEDIDGAAIGGDGKIYLSTLGSFSVPGVTGADEDVFVCTPTSLGDTTACTYTLFFDGSVYGLGANDIDAIDVP